MKNPSGELLRVQSQSPLPPQHLDFRQTSNVTRFNMNDRDLLRQPSGLSQGSTLGVFNVNVMTKNGDLVEDVAQYIDRDDMEVAKSQRPESPL